MCDEQAISLEEIKESTGDNAATISLANGSMYGARKPTSQCTFPAFAKQKRQPYIPVVRCVTKSIEYNWQSLKYGQTQKDLEAATPP